ncbi:ATP-binding protein, partial [Methylomonas sp. SURF-1]
MVNPNSKITSIVIEGSKEPDLAGEYVMDVTEYSEAADDLHEEITYYQLKHSSKRVDQPFELSELKNTITGFADRYRDHLKRQTVSGGTITFAVITNRPLSDTFKDGIQAIATGEKPETKFLNTLKRYTQLADEALQRFCAAFQWADDESNFAEQKSELHFEMASFFAGVVEHEEINNVVELVQKQVLPGASGKISPENVLMCLGVTSKEHLFPAPPKFEPLNNPIQREQHAELLAQIVDASEPVIIHAGGGVGKSVVCRLLADDLPTGSVGIIYDCFGGGEYLNVIKKRHRYRDALIQIANELALLDLCEHLILRSKDSEDDLLRAFLSRLDAAGKKLRQVNPNSILAIFIDAADNAEMAAADFGEQGFVPQLLRQQLPIACRIISLCRTERVNLLAPKQNVQQLPLLPFSQTETLNHLRKHFPNACADDGLEFHRLTGGNPRVQANAINFSSSSLSKVLTGLGLGRTVEEQIAAQLKDAIARLKEHQPSIFQQQIDAICLGLANLYPFIPIEVLAAAAEVDSAAVKSFVADLGRPLWLSDNSVQFRDEPTETWFRQEFSASPEQIGSCINRLKPLATQFNYVAEVLPILLLRSENYAELIRLALSDELLPESPIDKRNVRVYRLQFAFKAALRQQLYADATKLALCAGEEMAGDQRQLELLGKNTDLIAPLQSPQRVQELAL